MAFENTHFNIHMTNELSQGYINHDVLKEIVGIHKNLIKFPHEKIAIIARNRRAHRSTLNF